MTASSHRAAVDPVPAYVPGWHLPCQRQVLHQDHPVSGHQLSAAQQEDKTAIFEEWCSFLNFFDSSIHFELSFMNMATDAEVFEKNIRIPYRNDNFNNVRSEYSQMLKMQLAQAITV